MARKVFLIYQGADAHRAEQLAALKAIKACKLVSDQGREAVVQAGGAAAVGWIRRQIRGCSCAIVLIGSETCGDRWVNQALYEAWESWKGLFAIHVHRLRDEAGRRSKKGPSPFERYVMDRDNSLSMSSVVRSYDPPFSDSANALAHIKKNLARWVEEAISIRLAY